MEGEILNKDVRIFFSLLDAIWAKRIRILIWVITLAMIGFVIIKLSTKIYTAKSVFVPQTDQGQGELSNLGGLASLAGINIGSMGKSTEIPPELYPELIKSIQFKRSLINAQLSVSDGKSLTYKEYYDAYNEESTIKNFIWKLPTRLYGVIQPRNLEMNSLVSESDHIKVINKEEEKHLERITKQLNVNVKKKEGIVELSFSMPDPFYSARMTEIAERLLQEKIISYRIQSAQQQLEFTQQRYQESKKTFELIQEKRANFSDGNRNISTESARSKLNRIDSEYDIAFSVFKELAGQLEQAKIQVNKNTPVFMNIQPIVIPQQKSRPKSLLIIISFMFLGFLIPTSLVVLKMTLYSSKT